MYEEALELLEELEKDPQRLKACNCGIRTINLLRDEIKSFQTGDYKVSPRYSGEHYFLDSFFPKTKEDSKLVRIFEKIYNESRKKKK